MTGRQIRKKRLTLENRLSTLATQMTYSEEIKEILEELENLRISCPHERLSDGTCLDCLSRVDK